MIILSNGHSFTFMAASGALAFDGRGWPWERPLRWVGLLDLSLFTVVTKTISLHPRRGNLRWFNPLRSVRPLRGGAVNAVGLTNPGIDWFLQKIIPRLQNEERKVILSLEVDDENELMEMLKRLNEAKGPLPFLGLELNPSSPNTSSERKWKTDHVIRLVEGVKRKTRLPLLLKVGINHEYLELTKRLQGTIEAVSINTIPWSVAFPGRRSPLERFGGGGVSGKIAQRWTWKMTEELVRAGSVPVIGPSPWNYEDIQRLFDLGSKAVSFGSVFLWHPWRPTLYTRRWLRENS